MCKVSKNGKQKKSRKKQEEAIMRKKWNPGIRVFAGVVLTAAILSGCGMLEKMSLEALEY